jgi:hypothetical protein
MLIPTWLLAFVLCGGVGRLNSADRSGAADVFVCRVEIKLKTAIPPAAWLTGHSTFYKLLKVPLPWGIP